MCPHCGSSKCFQDVHHQFWPRRAYSTPLERKFRALHTIKLWRCQHNEIHATTKPPQKPSRKQMEWVVERLTRRGRGRRQTA